MVIQHESFSIEIDGSEISDIYPDLIRLDVELDDDIASMFRLQLAASLEPDGAWTHIDGDGFSLWGKVDISAGFDDAVTDLITAYVTHLRPKFDPDPSQCSLEIWGMDGSVLMDREEKLKDWPSKKDSDIAVELFQTYGFNARVDHTPVIHDEAISTIIQRETDFRFLRRLAKRNGFECFVDGATGYFRAPKLDPVPQPLLAAHFGSETNLLRFSVEVNALLPSNVSMSQLDRTNKEVLETAVRSSRNKALGGTTAGDLVGAGVSPAQMFVSMTATTGTPEMTSLCQGLFHDGEWFVTGEGEVAGNRYGHVLKPRQTVTIKGVGETHSGIYYVSHVTHSFTPDGYTQTFRVKRNGLFPTGSEDFSGASGRLF